MISRTEKDVEGSKSGDDLIRQLWNILFEGLVTVVHSRPPALSAVGFGSRCR